MQTPNLTENLKGSAYFRIPLSGSIQQTPIQIDIYVNVLPLN